MKSKKEDHSLLSKRDEDSVANLSLAFFVRRVIDYFAVEEHRRRAAAIEVHRVHRAELKRYSARSFRLTPPLDSLRPSTVIIRNIPSFSFATAVRG